MFSHLSPAWTYKIHSELEEAMDPMLTLIVAILISSFVIVLKYFA